MEAGKKDIQMIFNRSWNLTIPFFQRPYVWEAEQWERFLNDMYTICEHKQEYFLGSVILKQENEQSQDNMVVDGQQRLTTLLIFFKVLLLKQDKNREFDNLFKKIENNQSILRHNKNDRKSFELILNLGTLQNIDKPSNKIESCYQYFLEQINAEELDFYTLLKFIKFVGIQLGVDENEQQIFDTINSLGVNLTTAELLKNLLFHSDEIGFYKEYWEDVFEKDAQANTYWFSTINKDGKALIDIFLFSFLQIQAKKLTPKERSGFGQMPAMFRSYKKLMSKIEDKESFLKELKLSATIFRRYINPEVGSERLTSQMDRINLIIFEGNVFSIIPYVVFILINTEGNLEERDKILFVLESYLMRRMLGIERGTLIAKDYAELFGSRLIFNNIVSARELKAHFNSYNMFHLHHVPSDKDITLLLKNKSQAAKKALLVIYLLDNKIRQDKGSDVLYGFKKYSVEYLMPVKWEENWGRPVNEEAREIAVKTLGNMTITPQKLNNSLKNADWQTRLEGKDKAKGLKSYSHFSLVKPLLHYPTWDENKIFENDERLAKRINEIWQL